MKPRAILLENIAKFIQPHLEALGFKYSPSSITFTRPCGIVKQKIGFSLNRLNSENDCTFWTMWSASSFKYKKWHKDEFGTDPASSLIGGEAEWNLKGWPRGPGDRFSLSNNSRDESIMSELREAIDNIETPYLNRISSSEGAARQLKKESMSYSKAADLLIISGNLSEAKEVLQDGITTFEEHGEIDQFDEVTKIKIRLERFFGS